MINTKIIKFKDIIDIKNDQRPMGHLTPVEGNIDIPFDIKRIYYLTCVPENTIRGFHSHKSLKQVLICLNGSVKVSVSTPYEKEIITLDVQTKGLYIGPMVWREMYGFSPGSVLLVLASENYNESDYIRDYREYCEIAQEYFQGNLK
jgi:dTDP-4-dehydrorhamnose 3,5-epimerase-like enzyme